MNLVGIETRVAALCYGTESVIVILRNGMPIRETDEAACVAWLMRLYQEKVAELDEKAGKTGRKK